MTIPTPPADNSATVPMPTPAPPAPPARRWTRFITPVLSVVAALVIGLFGGILIGQHTGNDQAQRPGFTRPGGAPGQGGFGRFGGGQGGRGAQGGQGGQGGGLPGGGFTTGTITSIDGDTITITAQDGSTERVTTSGTTTVTTTAKSTVSDLKSGESIIVRGQKDSSGNVTATSVSEGGLGFGRRAAAGN